jgi:hypothetical protein
MSPTYEDATRQPLDQQHFKQTDGQREVTGMRNISGEIGGSKCIYCAACAVVMNQNNLSAYFETTIKLLTTYHVLPSTTLFCLRT